MSLFDEKGCWFEELDGIVGDSLPLTFRSMMENHLYNLMAQLVTESKSLKRIKEMYGRDADGCESCKDFWSAMEQDKTAHVEKLNELIKQHNA